MAVEKRRPWIDWIHSALVQGNLIRDFVKYDDQPASIHSVPESIYRAYRIAVNEPAGPAYVCLDAAIQEEPLPEKNLDVGGLLQIDQLPDPRLYTAGTSPGPDLDALKVLANAVWEAEWPVIVAERTGQSTEAFFALSKIAQEWSIPVIGKESRLNIPTHHPMNMNDASYEIMERADVVIAVDVGDIYRNIAKTDRVNRTTKSVLRPEARIFSVGLEDYGVRSWASDYHQMYPTELNIRTNSEVLIKGLGKALNEMKNGSGESAKEFNLVKANIDLRRNEAESIQKKLRLKWQNKIDKEREEEKITVSVLASEMWKVIKDYDFVLANGNLRGWTHRIFNMDQPRQFLGHSGGAGLGYGIGATIGACLAHRGSDKLIVDIQSDGDLLFTPGGLWTLAHHKLPALIVMNNNRTYFNSEKHQATTAEYRGRDVSRAGIGTKIEEPAVNFAELAHSMGVHGIGPIEHVEEIVPALQEAVDRIRREKKAVLVDIITKSE